MLRIKRVVVKYSGMILTLVLSFSGPIVAFKCPEFRKKIFPLGTPLFQKIGTNSLSYSKYFVEAFPLAMFVSLNMAY